MMWRDQTARAQFDSEKVFLCVVKAEELWRRDIFLGRSAATQDSAKQLTGVSGLAMNRRSLQFSSHSPDPSDLFAQLNQQRASSRPSNSGSTFGRQTLKQEDQIPSNYPQFADYAPFSPFNRGSFFLFHGNASPTSLNWLTKNLKLGRNTAELKNSIKF
ncbi:unnamed protein product, partial [Mesorhabditis spiculigera]